MRQSQLLKSLSIILRIYVKFIHSLFRKAVIRQINRQADRQTNEAENLKPAVGSSEIKLGYVWPILSGWSKLQMVDDLQICLNTGGFVMFNEECGVQTLQWSFHPQNQSTTSSWVLDGVLYHTIFLYWRMVLTARINFHEMMYVYQIRDLYHSIPSKIGRYVPFLTCLCNTFWILGDGCGVRYTSTYICN